jgi:polyisoprenoid-binding protein YceI
MIKRTSVNLIAILLATFVSYAASSSQRVHLLVIAGSKLTIDGTSTFHDYECGADSIRGTLESDTTALARNSLDSVFTNAKIDIPVKSLHGSSDGITENMESALKSDKFPVITFVLTHCGAATDSLQKPGAREIEARGNLTIAGQTRTVQILASVADLKGGVFRLQGSYDLLMTDYGVDPPTFMFGVMKASPKVTIHFDLKLFAQ